MIKRTPQEIADFFGCYVAQNRRDRGWCMFDHKPCRGIRPNIWVANTGERDFLLRAFVEEPTAHDWTILYEPRFNISKHDDSSKKEKKLVPFDLSKKEDRDALRGKWITSEDFAEEYLIHNFSRTFAGTNPIKYVWSSNCGNGEALFKYYTFLDGSPVGKEVEE